MYQQQQPPVYYANTPQQHPQVVQVVPPPSNNCKSSFGLLLCYYFMIITGLILTYLGGGIVVIQRVSEGTEGKNMLADALEISFVVLTPISLLLTIMNCIVECRNQVKDEPRTRSRNIDDLGFNIAAAVILFLASVMLIAGSLWLCESIEVPEKREDEFESERSAMSGPRGCHLRGLTWVKVPAGIIGVITSFIYAGPITLACKDLKKLKKEEMNSVVEDLEQVQQGPPPAPYNSNDQPQGMYSMAPSAYPSYVQQQQQQVVYQPAPYYYVDPNAPPPPPSYQTY